MFDIRLFPLQTLNAELYFLTFHSRKQTLRLCRRAPGSDLPAHVCSHTEQRSTGERPLLVIVQGSAGIAVYKDELVI